MEIDAALFFQEGNKAGEVFFQRANPGFLRAELQGRIAAGLAPRDHAFMGVAGEEAFFLDVFRFRVRQQAKKYSSGPR